MMKRFVCLLALILGITAACEDVKKVEVASVNLNETALSLHVGETFQLVAEVLPDNVEDKTVVWSTENSEVVSVGQDGVVTALAAGTSKVYATAGDVVAECSVTVSDIPVEAITLDEEEIELYSGEEFQLTAIILPIEVSDRPVAWKSSDESIVTVDDTGLVRAVKIGTAKVTATVDDKSAECLVTVNERLVESVTIDETSIEIVQGETQQLTAVVLPENADNKSVEWSSSDESIATVSADGLVTAVNVGSAQIFAKAGDKQGRCDVTVVGIPVESVTLDKDFIELSVGGTYKFEATVLPENAYDKTIVWSSDDESIVNMYYGTISAKKAGTTYIRAKAGEVEAVCEVVVKATEVNVGDFYYSDGTWSTELDEGKTCIGIVFWAGDPSAYDPVLKSEHPECTNGLVLALDDINDVVWQANHASLTETVGDWIEANTEYGTITVPDYMDTEKMSQRNGYSNTKGLVLYNESNPDTKVGVVDAFDNYISQVQTPANSSGWYIPSVKELALARNHIDENPYFLYSGSNVSILINTIMQDANIGDQFVLDDQYWTSTEYSNNKSFIMARMGGYFSKEYSIKLRVILAF